MSADWVTSGDFAGRAAADKPRLKIGQPDIIGPTIGIERGGVAAPVAETPLIELRIPRSWKVSNRELNLTVGKLPPLLDNWPEAGTRRMIDNFARFAASCVERQRKDFERLPVRHPVCQFTGAISHCQTSKGGQCRRPWTSGPWDRSKGNRGVCFVPVVHRSGCRRGPKSTAVHRTFAGQRY
jgi:hypothetical protein